MSTSKTFFITTTLPYVNAEPHIGFAMEIIRADTITRFKKSQSFEVFFNTGTDEHGQKILEVASKAGKEVQLYVDEYSKHFEVLLPKLGISKDIHFIRTTDPVHVKAAESFWRRVRDNGFIYKKKYKAKYCVGCEEQKTDSELVDGRCPIHPNREIETIEEENYFFKFSEFGEKLLKFYDANPDFVMPTSRLNEMKEFVKRGLQDFSISRLASKMSWGVSVPDDSEHVMYVWFEALVSYISTLGWPDNKVQFEKFWVNGTPVQYCGKDNTRFQGVMWQAMLMAAGLPNSDKIVVNGFITSGGQKMSKSLGNVIDPISIVNEYGTDALRYYVLRELSPFEDSDFTLEKFKEAYNANLANGLGNLVSRVLTMANKNGVALSEKREVFDSKFLEAFEKFEINKAADIIWQKISAADEYIQKTEPFKKIKTAETGAKKDIAELLARLYEIAFHLQSFLPQTAQIILDLLTSSKIPTAPLFPRKD
ncbi:MAG: methionine--tRNA ligase [Candidatus Taylorbacteria bacterium RIFCSPHIGHO2_02_FULL_45_35]|uniref:Methionine--tRNA ligase n=1 Tax=Candidatus Taylorbacteria bacterium RIFCSPHIGHO2_02_FULL_45_35 TaxID=1802311 RepID=A0A1G2MS56_9BACT|nr:MAG: methionine--tRNA ligase [Candidatus Taylorbacteria bacterium RIFCSPHIGHO2_02_FULL_45_35]OHA33789.1 MAG: methionine--tRNA ligase [Candidatus Taylorbacteria bacterium RIFCSPLOWO2_01_FULL_45_34b]